MFYKIVFNNMIIDAICNPIWVIWLSNSGRFMRTDPHTANGIVSRDGNIVYNIFGKDIFLDYYDSYKTVSIIEISEEEYNNLISQITSEVKEIENQDIVDSNILQEKIFDIEENMNDILIQNDNFKNQIKVMSEVIEILLGV